MLNSLRFRLTLIFLSLAAGPLILVGTIIGQRSFTTLERQSLVLQREVAAHMGSEIRAFVEERENELVVLDQVHGLGTLDFEQQRAMLSSVLQHQQVYQEVALLDSAGQEQIRLSRSSVVLDDDLRNRADDEDFLSPALRGETYFGPVRFDQTLREPLVTISVPLFDRRRGEIVSVLAVDLRFKPIWDLLADIELSTEGEIYVSDQTGQVVAHRNPAIVLRSTTIDLPKADGRAAGLSGTDAIIARDLIRFGDQELVVIAEQPVFDALELAANSLWVALAVTSVALLAAVLLVLFTIRQIVSPIETLATSARAISSGDFSQVNVSSRDEIGQLASAFNQMVNDLAESRARIEQYTLELESKTEQAEQARRAAEAANRAKSAFLANMSHELRTPLNAILGFSELIMRDPNLAPVQQENLATIGRSGEHLLALINDVLELSKIEAGHAELHKESFDLYHLLLGIEEMFRLRAARKGLSLVFERGSDVPQYVRTDENRLRQVLINLLSNAVKFTQEGSVTLRVRPVSELASLQTSESASVEPANRQTCRLVFEVKDTGIGIAPEEQDAVFDAFVQTTTGQQSHQGTGLGIPISLQSVHLMGGDLTVSSEAGRGSTFKFDVQVERVGQSEIEHLRSQIRRRRVVGLEPGQRAADGGPYRLLVVEDVKANRELLVKLLQLFADPTGNRGFDVRAAANGQEAIDIWQEWKPHLIWMDMRMPVMDGYEATQHIKMTPQDQNTVIIALTASAFEEDRATALAAGCDGFVRKPFRGEDIFDALTRHLGVRFVYGETDLSETDTSTRGARTPRQASDTAARDMPDLAAMSSEWLAEMYQATLEGDLGWMTALIEQIRAQDVTLANAWAELASSFDHNTILQLIRRATEN